MDKKCKENDRNVENMVENGSNPKKIIVLSRKNDIWGAKMEQSRSTRPSWDARGTPTQVGRDTPIEAATDPLRGSGPWMAQVDVNDHLQRIHHVDPPVDGTSARHDP